MNQLLWYYVEGGLISAIIVLLLSIITKQRGDEGIKIALLVGLIWPAAWPLTIYMIIKGRNNK